jgi:hypothetical protein
MGFSILNHEKKSMLEISYGLGTILVQELPDLEPLFESPEPHEIPHDLLGDLRIELTDAVQAWIRAGRLDSTKDLYAGRRRSQAARVSEYSLVEVARNLRDVIEEQFARGEALWVS